MKLEQIRTALYLEDVFGITGKCTQSGLFYWRLDAVGMIIILLPSSYMQVAFDGCLSHQFCPELSKVDLISIDFFASLKGSISQSKLVNKIASAWKKDEA